MKRITVFNKLIHLPKLYLLFMILVSNGSLAADYRYEECVPKQCREGPNISFPFHIAGQQASYCGYPAPGFTLNCSENGFPVLNLGESEYTIEDISYDSRSFRVFNSEFVNLNSSSSCVPRFRNTSLGITNQFEYGDNVKNLHVFSNCSDSIEKNVEREGAFCDEGENIGLTLYEGDEHFADALGECGTNLVAPVEDNDDGGNRGTRNLVHDLRRGFVVKWTASDCSECKLSGGYCGFNETDFVFKCFCPDSPRSWSCKPESHGNIRLLILNLGSGLGAVLVVTSVLVLFILRRKKTKNKVNNKNIELFMKQHGDLAPRRYKYSELKKMTKSFSDELGQGGYGRVYKAKSHLDGRLMAIKLLNKSKNNGEEFLNEVASISRTSHVNIVTLIGFCIEGTKRALVYEFMPNGSLDKFIAGKSSLSEAEWEKLFVISVGVARGLDYLHRGCQMQILHLDIKPHNILLDKDFSPKISDFGLAKLRPDRASITSMLGPRGTVGYIAPEVFCRNYGKVSHKSDVYSYGMMVLDIVGEKGNNDPGTHDQTSELYFPNWIYKHLDQWKGDQSVDDVTEDDGWRLTKRKLTIVGLWCIQTDPNDRPSMGKVVEMLEGKLESLSIPPKPYFSSSPTRLPHSSFSESSSI